MSDLEMLAATMAELEALYRAHGWGAVDEAAKGSAWEALERDKWVTVSDAVTLDGVWGARDVVLSGLAEVEEFAAMAAHVSAELGGLLAA